jgi:hypothetical protein
VACTGLLIFNTTKWILHEISGGELKSLIRLIKMVGLWFVYIISYLCIDTTRYKSWQFLTQSINSTQIQYKISKLWLSDLIHLNKWIILKSYTYDSTHEGESQPINILEFGAWRRSPKSSRQSTLISNTLFSLVSTTISIYIFVTQSTKIGHTLSKVSTRCARTIPWPFHIRKTSRD